MDEVKLAMPYDCIEKYNKIWSQSSNPEDYIIKLSDGESVDISKYKGFSEDDFNLIRQGEVLLNSLFSNMKEKRDLESVQMAVIVLDSLYHTQLKNPMLTAQNLYNDITCVLYSIESANSSKEKKRAVDTIARINKDDVNLYSFASKFCSFCGPKEYPIIDRYSVTLLYRYLYPKNKKVLKYLMGNYEYYINQYEDFIDIYNLRDDRWTYKAIDKFLWTYGKLLFSLKRMRFDGVLYIPIN